VKKGKITVIIFLPELKRKKEKLNYIKMQLKRMKFCINDTNCQYEISTGY